MSDEIEEPLLKWGEPATALTRGIYYPAIFTHINLRKDSRQALQTFKDIFANECTRCGLCCIYYGRKFQIPVALSDTQVPPKLVQIGPRLKMFKNDDPDWDTTRFMRRVDHKPWPGNGKCIALEGKPREKIGCSIYPLRPRPCHEFDAGSNACMMIRTWGSLENDLPDVMALGRS